MNHRQIANLSLVCVLLGMVGIALFKVELKPAHATVYGLAHCDRNTLVVSVFGDDAPFTITGSGPGLPLTLAATRDVTIAGPATWTDLTVTNAVGATSVIGARGCPLPTLALMPGCRIGGATGQYLEIEIFAGEGPFFVTGTGPGLPFTTATTAAQIIQLAGPAQWLNIMVIELGGNHESFSAGDFQCGYDPNATVIVPTRPPSTPDPNAVQADASCNGPNLVVRVFNLPTSYPGASPYVGLRGNGPGLELGGVSQPLSPNQRTAVLTLQGPGTWQNLGVYGPALWNDEPYSAYSPVLLNSVTCPIGSSNMPEEIVPTPVPTTFSNTYGVPRIIQLSADRLRTAYDRPNGSPIVLDGVPLQIPQDTDGSGSDTFEVMDVVQINGYLWIGLNVGTGSPVYILFIQPSHR